MFGHLRKEENDSKKMMVTSSTPSVSLQKPSPTSTSSDDQTKGENTQHFHDTATGTNSSRYARKKSGLKPIRPANISGSSLHPVTPGKLPQTPRLNFKENDHPRFGMHDFPSTPKFGRSESTPELHRIRKLDHLLHTADKNTTHEKTHSNILQESSVSNLLTLTSDSLPDIFRKPIIQQQPDVALSLQSKIVNLEEKVSKWGYGPNSNNTQSFVSCSKSQQNDFHRENSTNVHYEDNILLKPLKEETPGAVIKSSNFKQSTKDDHPLWNQIDKSSISHSSLPPLPLEMEEPVSSFNKSLNKSGLNSTASETASAYRAPTQPTVKIQPFDYPSTPLAKKLSWTNQSALTRTKDEAPLVVVSSSTTSAVRSDAQISSSKIQTDAPRIPEVVFNKLAPAETAEPIVKLAEIQSGSSYQDQEPLNKFAPPVTPVNSFLPPPSSRPPTNSRPPTKTKQISVNGKLYTVMKPLGRGGSSVVYQVLNQEMTDVFALKVVRLDSVDEITAEGYINEVRLLKQLQGLPRVVRLLEYEFNEEEEKLLLVMEKGDTDFATVIRNRTSLNAINPTLIRFYWQEMLEAVGEIHAKNVIHTDLKPANFLLVNGGLKLIDFGIATSIQADMTSIMKDSQCGTYNYMAPEAIKSASPVGANQEFKISRKTDVWSLGCMLYSLIYKNPPFNKFRDTIEKISAIVDDRHIIDFPSTADPMAIAVLKSCLDRNPRNRPSIEQLLSHPYLNCSNQTSIHRFKNSPDQLRVQLDPFIEGGKLTEEAKEIIRQWM